MSKAKTDAIAMVQAMPDDVTWEEVFYRIYVRAKIERGLADEAAGRMTPHDEFKAEVDQWLASLGRTPQSEITAKSSSGSLATH
jgi:predicted transcriptional regulator